MKIGQIRDLYHIDFEEHDAPGDDQVVGIVSERLTALLEARLRNRSNLERERMQRFLPLARELSANQDESAIIAMLLDDSYQQSLHSPVVEEIPEAPDPPASSSSHEGGDKRSRRGGGGRSGGRGGGSKRRRD